MRFGLSYALFRITYAGRIALLPVTVYELKFGKYLVVFADEIYLPELTF
jgi:hypothetical protein